MLIDALTKNVCFHGFNIITIPNCINMTTITPKITTPQLITKFRKLFKDLNGYKTLTNLHYTRRRITRSTLYQEMQMITIRTKCMKFQEVTFSNANTNSLNEIKDFIRNETLTIF